MTTNISTSRSTRWLHSLFCFYFASLVGSLAVAQSSPQTEFSTPQAAVNALVSAVKARQTDRTKAILGPEMKAAIEGQDPDLTQSERERFLYAAQRKTKVEIEGTNKDRAIAYFGEQEWPFPAPIVKKGDKWLFDSAAGQLEVENRTIGREELMAMAACEAYVQAQLDYFSGDWDEDGVLQFAQKLISTPGKKDGLYWNNDNGEPLSPLGPFFSPADEKRGSFEGYRFKILTRQGPAARGGARNYIIDNRLVLGFGLVAWPVDYGHSGVMTFIVNQLGEVYQKDLGPQTADSAKAMDEFNPDATWAKQDLDAQVNDTSE